MDHVWVILPTRRAVSVFNQELAELTDRPMLAPHAVAVDDFITEAADVQIIDSVSLLFELYDVFQQLEHQVEFDKFVGWASILLTDFDRIDQFLIDADKLFGYLTEAKRLETWNLQLPSGAAPVVNTPVTSQYFKLFTNLKDAYHRLRERLTAKGLAYRGMAYRLLANEVEARLLGNPLYEKIYFVGFNALSAAEEQIIRVLTKANKAELIWDTDAYYMQNGRQEAGVFLRKYKQIGLPGFKDRSGGPGLGNTVTTGRDLTETPGRTYRMVGVPTASLQAKLAGQLVSETPTVGGHTPRTAVVLADETLLIPVLYSLNETVRDLNVTMGLSLRHSLLFTLVDTLFELQRTLVRFNDPGGQSIPKFHHRQVTKLLNHPFVRQYATINELLAPDQPNELPKPLIDWLLGELISGKRAYLSSDELRALGQQDALFGILFTPWPDHDPTLAIQALYELIDLLRDVYREGQDTIEIEYLYLFFSLLKQLETTLRQQAQQTGAPGGRTPAVTLKSFRQFLNELIRQTTIPFTSEGDSPVQLMGLLETRGLDFERVIVLSANEGVLPQARKHNSLIPFDIALEVGLPTYREQESITAYHLYRLLQRAKDVTFLYTTTPDAYGNGKGEPSRFLRQIEHELVPAANGTITLFKPGLRLAAGADRQEAALLQVQKSDAIKAKLTTYLTKHGIYPTHLNQYVSCGMQFYFHKLVNIREERDLDEHIGTDEFGTWMHETLEAIDRDYRMRQLPVTKDIVLQVLKEQYAKVMSGRVADTGYNLLFYKLAEDIMVQFQQFQNEETARRGIRILGLEEHFATTLPVDIGGGTIVHVRIGGKLDRTEQLDNGTIRIVDYKTGKVELPVKMPNLRESITDAAEGRWDKIRQLWLYKYLFLKSGRANGYPVEAGFYSFRADPATPQFKTNRVAFSDDNDHATYIEESEKLITIFVQRMFSDDPFTMTTNLAACEFCQYTKICGR
ncbi:PD-(D/E)XK nuclease family protein [Fibrella sp. HMF5335]|uniref:PD-(D/E)XK nuclease family protein n=2 Tax=Fibrella rubiginis TaxID=2817060 RepID=A0A939GFN8_9BACT|nr:PD-(D/E)XK nuclease family protein [Fibrella rubiginis]